MKLKTKKAAAKRFSFTATGKVKFRRSKRGHLLSKKSNVKMLGKRKDGIMCEGDARTFVSVCLTAPNVDPT